MTSSPALPGLDLAPTPAPQTINLGATRTPRKLNPYTHLANPRADRGIRALHCPRCRAPIITGTDADYCAEVILADVTPLSTTGEMVALLGGRTTYTLEQPLTGCARLFRRNTNRIARQQPGKPRMPWHHYDVIAGHQCGQEIPDTLTIPTMLAPHALEIDPNEPPPF